MIVRGKFQPPDNDVPEDPRLGAVRKYRPMPTSSSPLRLMAVGAISILITGIIIVVGGYFLLRWFFSTLPF